MVGTARIGIYSSVGDLPRKHARFPSDTTCSVPLETDIKGEYKFTSASHQGELAVEVTF